MYLFAFDRDSTVETSGGPIPIEKIRRLREGGHLCFTVGNEALCGEAGIPSGHFGLASKEEMLRELARRFPYVDGFFVVDDVEIRVEGWRHLTPEQFMETW